MDLLEVGLILLGILNFALAGILTYQVYQVIDCDLPTTNKLGSVFAIVLNVLAGSWCVAIGLDLI